jgi:DNA mismatch repair protein MutL
VGDIIQLLPDNIANQIAAGEVIQRPASAVKELLENAVDAGADNIQLIVNDAGKSLIQVIDNGGGMSETDARMAFERHATSKINTIEDLFRIRTMGFRGEALASIAAVAQVSIRTRRAEDEMGTVIEIENSVVLKQEPAAAPLGTSLSMKNVFFNIPARRNFLKSNAAELRHIVDEFIRVAMAFPHIFFSLSSNGQQIFHLEKGSLKQRMIQLLGSQYNARLVTVQEKTDYLNITGFVGKPEASKKTRGDQFFFVNNRFIRSAYLHHAVMNAYQDMIASDSFPLYVLFIDLDPAQIDINVHPTKQEIKFEDEKIVYAFVQAAVKHALAQFSITPTLDFELDASIQQLDAVNKPFTDEMKQTTSSSNLYKTFTQKNQAHFIEPQQKSELKHWREVYEGSPSQGPLSGHPEVRSPQQEVDHLRTITPVMRPFEILEHAPHLQLHNSYVLVSTNRGFILVDQQLAHQRILYEQFVEAMNGQSISSQQSLFPITIQLSSADAVLLTELLGELQLLGYQIESFGKDSFIVQGVPADILKGNEKNAIEQLLDEYKHFNSDVKLSRREILVRSLANQHSVKSGTPLEEKEMKTLVAQLFNCTQSNVTPDGKPTYIEFKKEYVEKLFSGNR